MQGMANPDDLEAFSSEGSEMDSGDFAPDPPSFDLRGATQMLNHLHIYDRPVDVRAMSLAVADATKYLQLLLSGAPNDEAYEAGFLRPFFQETVTSVFNRILSTETHNMSQMQHLEALQLVVVFSRMCGILLQYCWRSTAEFTPTLPQQMQQDLQGPLSAFSWLTNPTTPFAMHHRFLPPVPQGCQNLLARFNWALPLTHPTPAVEGAAGGDDTPEAIIHEHFVLANAINWFGNAQGFQIIFSALQHPDRCGLTGIHTLLLVLQHSVGHFFKQETRQLVLQPLNAILDYIQHGLAAAEGFAAFEEGDQAYAILLQILTTCRWLAAAVPGGEAASERVTPLQREIVLRLLSSGNFNRQLAGVKELNNLLRLSSLADDAAAQEEGTIEETLAAGGGIESDGDASGPQPGPSMALILGWMREKQVARLMLQSNLHQAQYAEAAQRVLSIMLRYNSLPQDQLEFLWRFTEDASTFEDIKVNVYGMLGMLGPYMTPSQHDQMFKRLRSRLMEPACPDLPHILDFLVSMARNDARNAVGNRILAVLLDLVLRPDAPREAVQSTAVADVCNAYEDVQHSHMLATIASGQCLERLHQSTGSVNGAHLLYMLLVTESPKKPIETRLMSTLNQGGELIVAVMDSFGAFLDQQRAAAAANPSGEPPPVCSFTHKEAVEVYNRLLLEILPKGSFFVSLGQLGIFLRWATERAPTPEDADVVWNTLTSMVHGRKEVEQPTALEFFQTKLCHVAPEAVTPHAWRCITAFMAALADWNVELTQERGAVDFAATVARSPGETWTLGRALLAAIALRGPSIVAPKAALLLAQLVALSLRKGSSPEEVRSRVREEVAPWRQEVEGAFSQLFVRTPSSWHESVPLREELFTPEVGAALQRADRALMYLDFLIDNGRGGVLPMQFQHEASYRDTDVVLDLRVQPFGPLLAMQQAQKGHGGAAEKPTAHSIPVLLPANAFIGTLRITAAEAVSKVIGMHTSPAHLMLVGMGKRYTDDAAIVGLPNLGPAVMVAYTEQPNAVSDVPPDARALLEAASPAAALADDSDLYAMVLNLAQLRPHWGDGALVFACRMRANRFLNAMPTCKDAIADAERLLQSEDCSQEVLQLVCLPPAAGAAAAGAAVGGGRAPNDAVLRYFLEVLAALVLPTRNPLKPEAAEDAEEKACFLLSRMFPSRMMPMLYELVQNHPWLGGLVIAPTVHSVLLLISTRIAVEMSRHMQLMKQAHAQQHRVQQIAVGAAARAELQRSRSTTPGADGGEVASALANCALTALQAMLSGNKPSYSSAPGLCQRGLELLDMSIALDAQVIDRLVSSPATHDGHNLFGRVVHCMLACSHEEIRTMASQWLSRFAGQSPAARGWTFTGVVTKLLGLTEPNDQQAEVCSNILSSLAPGEAAIASGLLEQLAPRLLAAIDGGLPLRNIAASMEALVRCLRDRAVNEAGAMITKLVDGALFPELSTAQHGNGAEGTQALAELFPHTLQTASRGMFCREACFELLLELMLHDYGSWTHGYDLLLRTLARAADALPLKFNNEPLPSLRAPGALSGLQNGGATCYMNATFQQLFMQPTVRQLVLSSPGVHPEDQADSVFHQFQQMFAHLAAGVEPWYEPQGFWRAFKDYEGRPVNIREHQDAYEFFTRLQDSIDEHLRSLGAPRAIHAALGGTFAQVITVAGRPELRSQRDEDFYQISLDVRGKKGLEESLESYVAVELMDGQNQWHCEALNAKVDAEKRTLIRSLPHTLMLHLKRFEWDYETFSRWKVKDKFEFPLSLDMKPFTEEGAAAQAAAGDDSAGNGGDLRPDEYYQYELRGIVVHSGTAFAGHYYSYIKDRSNGVWYCFDDTSVELWDVTCLEVDCFGGKYVAEGTTQEFDRPHSAYMLVYERVAEMAEPLNEPAATATAAAPVKLPTEPVPMDTAPANASTPTPMLTSPPVAAQPAHAPLQLAAAAAAIPGAYDAVLSADPAIQTMLVTRNTEAIAGYHILGLDFLHFFNLLCDEVRCALQSGRPRKVARSAGLTSPGNGGDGGAAAPSPPSRLIALGANKSPVAQALVLCWDYYCRIVARASEDLSLEISNRRIRGVRGGLLHCSKHLDGAMTLVEYASEDETAPYLVQALGCPIDDARETVRYALLDAVNCLRSAYGAEAAYNEVHPIIEYFVTDVLGKIGPRLRPIFVWEEVLSLVATIVDSDDSYAVMLQPHLGIVLNLGGPLTAHWNRMPPDEHMHYDFGSYYVMLLSALLRTHNPGSLASKRYANAPNPFCIPVGGPFTHPLLPQLAWDFLFPPGAPEDALSKVLLPGAVSTQSAAQLLKWIIWNNNAKYVDVVCAVLNHINRDLLRTEEVAAEVMVLAEAMAVADAQQRDRLEDFLWGPEESGAVVEGTQPSPLGLIDLSDSMRGTLKPVLLIRLIMLLQEHAPENFKAAFDEFDPERSKVWRRWAIIHIQDLGQRLQRDRSVASHWDALCREFPALARRLNLEELQAQLFPADDDGTFWEDEEGNRQDAGPSNPGAGAGGDATQGLTAGAHGASEAPNARGFGLLPEGARIMQPQAQTFAHAGPAAHVVAAPPGGGGGGAGGVEDDEEPVAEITLDDDAENQQDGLPTAERIQSGGA